MGERPSPRAREAKVPKPTYRRCMTTARTIVASTIGFYVFVGAQALDALRANAANARRR